MLFFKSIYVFSSGKFYPFLTNQNIFVLPTRELGMLFAMTMKREKMYMKGNPLTFSRGLKPLILAYKKLDKTVLNQHKSVKKLKRIFEYVLLDQKNILTHIKVDKRVLN